MDDGESANSKPTLDARVAAVHTDVTHLTRRIDQVEHVVEQTRDELKESIAGVERDLKASIAGVEGDLKEMRREQDRNLRLTRDELKFDIREAAADLKEMIRDLKADNTEVRSAMRTELGHDRKVLYALCVSAIVMMLGLLAKGVLY